MLDHARQRRIGVGDRLDALPAIVRDLAVHRAHRDTTVPSLAMNANPFDRIGLVVHPRRELGRALATVREWAERQGAEIVQLALARAGAGGRAARRGRRAATS